MSELWADHREHRGKGGVELTIEIDEEDLDAATVEVVAAIDRSADRIVAALEELGDKLVENGQAQTSMIVREVGNITRA